MFPGVNGFHWTAGHIIFISLFMTVALIVAATMTMGILRSMRDARQRKLAHIRWHSEFHDLPACERACRHMLAGEVEERLCPNEFECRHCKDHPGFQRDSQWDAPPTETYGLDFPSDRFYHRGHTWVRPEADGTLTIGLDDLGRRLVGNPEHWDLPRPGARLENHGIAWRGVQNGVAFRVLAPIEGEVTEVGSPRKGWYLKVRPDQGKPVNLTHLLHGKEVTGWLRNELDRLQVALSPAATGASLADGGALMEDLTQAQPGADWDRVYGQMFLEA